MKTPRIDRVTFGTALLVVVAVCLPLGFFPEQSGPVVSSLYTWVTTNFGLAYQWFAIAAIVFLIWLGLSRHGAIKLGEPDDPPDFSLFSWVGMLFCAGVGAGLLVWAGTEWGYYYVDPPFGAEPRSEEAIEWASAYGLFHWGIVAWAIYALPAVAIAYPFYVNDVPHLRMSTGCHALLGSSEENSAIGRLMDVAFMVALLGGTGTSLGLTTPMIAEVFAELFGFENGLGLQLCVIAICIMIFGTSVWFGIERGIKRLSDLNVVLALGLLAYILIAGPTIFILKMGTDSLGFMLDNTVRMLTWTDPIEETGFVESWTIFYWAWWLAYAPFVGLFVARISRGRTIRQVIFSMLFFGSIGSWIFYIVMGDYALFLELSGGLSVTSIMEGAGQNAATAQIVKSLPFGMVALAVFAMVSIIFVATTYDSASYSLASAASEEIHAGQNPSRGHRLFWAFVLGVLPIVLLLVGGLKVIQSASLIASFPILFIGVAMMVSLVKSLHQDNPREKT